jgi:hypothetical protein
MRASEIAHATALRMLRAAARLPWMVEDILDKARAEHGQFDEYRLMADAMYADSEERKRCVIWQKKPCAADALGAHHPLGDQDRGVTRGAAVIFGADVNL